MKYIRITKNDGDKDQEIVYNAENDVLQGVVRERRIAMWDLVHKIMQGPLWPRGLKEPARITFRGLPDKIDFSFVHHRSRTISFSAFAWWCGAWKIYALHELAHYILRRCRYGHGVEWRRLYIQLLDMYYSRRIAARTRAAFVRRGLPK